jgi:poly(hydroxyalkanoate) depolymerase family esterase
MNDDFAAAMRRATHLTHSGDVATATQVIQGALGKDAAFPPTNAPQKPASSQQPHQRTSLRIVAANSDAGEPPREAQTVFGKGTFQTLVRTRKPLGEVLRLLNEGRRKTGMLGSLPGMIATGGLKASRPLPMPEGAQFLARSFSCEEGTRNYKLYVPASAHNQPRGLVVMLHGCKQDPNDFAVGTKMNTVAEKHRILVAYPAQGSVDNPMSCWNWFNPADQTRDAGEPAIIAGITKAIASTYHLNRRQVFAAGLSAGGAMAAVMAQTYPDLYGAVGIHSGLAYKSANDVVTAFSAMRGEAAFSLQPKPATLPYVRTIVFHGSADHTVSPSNAGEIVDAAYPQGNAASNVEQGAAASGHSYTRTVITGSDGQPVVEYWLIHGAGHAWSGGDPEGSYTDPRGPNASAEMMRFFLHDRQSWTRSMGMPPLSNEG